jgi:hypothetical protein
MFSPLPPTPGQSGRQRCQSDRLLAADAAFSPQPQEPAPGAATRFRRHRERSTVELSDVALRVEGVQ